MSDPLRAETGRGSVPENTCLDHSTNDGVHPSAVPTRGENSNLHFAVYERLGSGIKAQGGSSAAEATSGRCEHFAGFTGFASAAILTLVIVGRNRKSTSGKVSGSNNALERRLNMENSCRFEPEMADSRNPPYSTAYDHAVICRLVRCSCHSWYGPGRRFLLSEQRPPRSHHTEIRIRMLRPNVLLRSRQRDMRREEMPS